MRNVQHHSLIVLTQQVSLRLLIHQRVRMIPLNGRLVMEQVQQFQTLRINSIRWDHTLCVLPFILLTVRVNLRFAIPLQEIRQEDLALLILPPFRLEEQQEFTFWMHQVVIILPCPGILVTPLFHHYQIRHIPIRNLERTQFA